MTVSPFPPPGDFVPSTPDPTTAALVAMLIRYILAGLSAAGIATSLHLGDGALMLIGSSIVGALTVAWAIWERIQTARKAHQAAVESARRSAGQTMTLGHYTEIAVAPAK